MTGADLVLAVERHATSKLADDDLVSISTLGFRGEALPSIGAVARLSITSRHRAEPHAWSIEVDAGVKSGLKPAALGEGTRVEVRELFYATPARLKFLKTRPHRGRGRARCGAPARHEPAGRRLHPRRRRARAGQRSRRRCPVRPAALRALATCSARDFRANAVEIAAEREGVRVEGFAALPTLTRANALGQYLFVNGRPVRDKLLVGAVRAAYADYLPRDRHPLRGAVCRRFRRARSTSTCTRRRPRCAFATPAWCARLIVHALKAALARDGTRAATTGGSATIAAFRPRRENPRPAWTAAHGGGSAG